MIAAFLAATDPPTGLPGWAMDLIDTMGGPGIGVLTALEAVFPLSPSEPALVLGGVTTSSGRLNPLALVVWSTIGSVLGSMVFYCLGRWLGPERCRTVLLRLPLTRESDFTRNEEWFARRGHKAVLYGRLVPGVRTFISFPAGVSGMPVIVYVACTLLGSLIWNSALIGLGYLVGHNWSTIGPFVGVLAAVVVIIFWSLAIRLIVLRIRENRRSRRHTVT